MFEASEGGWRIGRVSVERVMAECTYRGIARNKGVGRGEEG